MKNRYIKPFINFENIEQECIIMTSQGSHHSNCGCKGNFHCGCSCDHKCTSPNGNGGNTCDTYEIVYESKGDFLIDFEEE